MSDVRNNTAEGRYELAIDGQLAITVYERRDGALVFTHTEVPQTLEGRRVGSRLVKAALADAREQGMKVVPICQFVVSYIERQSVHMLAAIDRKGAPSDGCGF